MEKVYICGIGAVSILGSNIADYEKRLREEKILYDGKKRYYKCILDNPAKHMKNRKSLKFYSLDSKMSIVASDLAIKDSGFPEHYFENDKFSKGLIMGTNYFVNTLDIGEIIGNYIDRNGKPDYELISEEGIRRLPPLWMLSKLPNTPAGQIAIENQIRGITYSLSNGNESGLAAIGEAYEVIKHNRADMVLSGGTDIQCTGEMLHDYEQKHLISHFPKSGAFDKKNAGYHLSEGAGFVAMVNDKTVKKYNLYQYCEIVGYSNTYIPNINAKNEKEIISGMINSMDKAVSNADIINADITFILASAGGNSLLDQCEAEAIEKLFGKDIAVSAPKSYVGNTRSAAGALAVIFACLEIKDEYCGTVGNDSEFGLRHSNVEAIKRTRLNKKEVYCVVNGFSELGEAYSLVLKDKGVGNE